MRAVEWEPIGISAQVNGGPEVVVFQKRKAGGKIAEILLERANFVAGAWQKGWDQFLTEKQRLAVGRYLERDDSGRIPSLEAWRIRLRDNRIINISRQSMSLNEKAGFGKFERLQRGEPEVKRRDISKLEMDSNTRELLFQNKHLSMRGFRELFGHSEQVIRRWIDEAEMPRRKTGHPRIEMSPEIKNTLLNNRHLSADAHRKIVGRSYKVVVRWREEVGIGKSPVGRPRKSGVSSY